MIKSKVVVSKRTEAIFKNLRNEVCTVHMYWKLFRGLFGTNKARIDLMNNCAPQAFYCIQEALLGYVVVMLNRITDRRTVSGKSTCTIDQLVSTINSVSYPKLLTALQNHSSAIDKAMAPLRKYRNKRIVHWDLSVALASNPINGVSRAMIEQVLKSIRDFMNCYERETCNELSYDQVIAYVDGEDLLTCLLKAVDYRRLMVNSEVPRHGDWKRGKFKDV